MANTVDKVLKIASEEVGYLEKSKAAWKQYGEKCLYDKTKYAGADNYTKYGYEMHKIYPAVMDFPAAWCDAFVDWCFYKAYGLENAKQLLGGNFDDYTKASVNLYINKGIFLYAKTGVRPVIGDQIFFSKDGTYNGIYHTGLVYDVDNNYVYTVEGNTSNSTEVVPNGGGVYKKKYLLSNTKIYGFGRPKYDSILTQREYWVESNGDWYYRVAEGQNTHGWRLINHHWYYFNEKGKMLKGVLKLTEETFYLNEEKGSLEGACCKTNDRGALIEWYVED